MMSSWPKAVVASPVLAQLAASLGGNVVEHEPEVILLGRDVHFSYQRLTSVANQLRRGATLMVANPDLSHPAADGGVTPETGSLMSAVIACAGVEPVCVVGKPEPLIEIAARDEAARLRIAWLTAQAQQLWEEAPQRRASRA